MEEKSSESKTEKSEEKSADSNAEKAEDKPAAKAEEKFEQEAAATKEQQENRLTDAQKSAKIINNRKIKCNDEEEYISPESIERRWMVKIFVSDLWKQPLSSEPKEKQKSAYDSRLYNLR